MKAWRQYRTDPFTDLLFNALLGFTFLFLVAVMLINPESRTGIIDPKAEYIISVRWPDNTPDDIDIWVRDPGGNLIWFRNPEVGLLHLDRDDRGVINDTITMNGEEHINPLNQEIVTIRGVVRGEYAVNVHYYASGTERPVPIDVRMEKVNPVLKVIYYGNLMMNKKGDEKTALRFRIGADGEISDINFLPVKLAGQLKNQ